ncbi:MAG: hypothetical protein M3T56_19535 [Chloroflexota bacterium]|nr:hypothetical protein [Chloroflexota bacterium]
MLSATASLGAAVESSNAGLAKAASFVTGSEQVAMLPSTSTLASFDSNIVLMAIVALTLAATLVVALVSRRT